MVIRFVIGTEGAVEKVTIVENATGHLGLARCVGGVFSRLEYPAAVQPITVNYPLSFAIDEE